MSFANILTIFNSADTSDNFSNTINSISILLTSRGISFDIVESTFFINTTSKQQTSDLITELKSSGYTYTFLFVNNIDGSAFRSNNVDQTKINHITSIFDLLTH